MQYLINLILLRVLGQIFLTYKCNVLCSFFNRKLKFFNFLFTFSITYIHCIKHLIGTPFSKQQSKVNFVRLFLILFLQSAKLMETASMYYGPLHSNYINLFFWATFMSPDTIYPRVWIRKG